MQKIKSLLISFLLLLGTCIINLSIHPSEVKAETDYSIPIRNNSLKPYKSNIPDEWYDASKNHGAFNNDPSSGSVDNCYLGVDFISEDGQVNYLNDDSFNIRVGETKSFYIELGFLNWGQGVPYNSVDFINASTILDVKVTQTHGDTQYTLFDSEDGDRSFYSTFKYDDLNSDMRYPLHQDYSSNTAFINQDFHLMKFELSATEAGFDVISFNFGDGKSGGCGAFIDLIIHCYDDDSQGIIDYKGADIQDIRQVSYGMQNLSADTPILLPLDLSSQYSFIPTYEKTYDNDSSCFVDYELLSLSNDLIINRSQMIYFVKPGVYDIICNVTLDISCARIDESDPSLTTTQMYQVYKSFTFKVSGYNSNSFTLTINENEVSDNTIYILNGETPNFAIKEIENNDNFEIKYFIDEKEYFNTPLNIGKYDLKVTILDYGLQNLINNGIEAGYANYEGISATTILEYTIIVKEENDMCPKPIFNTDENIIVVDSNESENPTRLTISNYDDIVALGQIDYYISANDYVVFDEGTFLIYGLPVGTYTLEVTAIYGNITKKAEIVIKSVSNIIYALDNSKINLNINSSKDVEIGILVNNEFVSLPMGDDVFIEYLAPQNGLVGVQSNDDNPYKFNIISNESTGNGTVNFIIYKNGISAILELDVVVGSESSSSTSNINFVEGDFIRLLLSDKTKEATLTLDPLLVSLGYDFSWLSLDSSIVSVEKLNDGEARIVAKQEGTTEIIAICQTSDGSTITSRATITVLSEIPDISIKVNKTNNDLSSFTIYDNLKVTLDSDGFTLSSNIIVTWYLDGEILTKSYSLEGSIIDLPNNSLNFNYIFSEGTHTLRVEVEDLDYDLDLVASKDISIFTVANQEKTLSFSEDTLYLLLSGTTYKLNVLMDGVDNQEYIYKWSVDNNSVVAIDMSENNTVLLKPIGVGKTTLNVFVDIGVYEERIIRSEITIVVDELETLELVPVNEFVKPGETIEMQVLVNESTKYKNFAPNITITQGEDEVEYEYNDGIITINNSNSGKYNFIVDYQTLNNNYSLNVTNFNLKQFVMTIFPYLVIILIIVVALYSLLKVKGDPYKNAITAAEKLKLQVENALKNDINDLTQLKVTSLYKNILRRTHKLHLKLIYYYDEGIDEFKNVISKVDQLEKVVIALIRTAKDIDVNKVITILESIRSNQVAYICNNIDEIIASRRKHEEVAKSVKKDDIKTDKKPKKKRKSMTPAEYEQYLIDQGIMDDNRTNSGD